ncbi:MAG: glucan biosynthesis protein D [Burkholderiaceae bacterium]
MHRRDFLHAAAALAAGGFEAMPLLSAATAPSPLKFLGKPAAFDYAWLKGYARQLAGQPYSAPKHDIPEEVAKLDYDQYQAINYRAGHALWVAEHVRFQARFFHLGLFFRSPVRIFELRGGQAQELAYDPAMFDYGKSGLHGKNMPQDLGFAGFRLNFHTDLTRDVVAFLGASYFRAVGSDWQYGLSARGLAIDCGMERPEEFPSFLSFWLERPGKNSDTLVVYALLDSASVTGAYRFEIHPAATLWMNVDAALYPRKAIERMGIAPLTSMFQYGENDRRPGASDDWRPEIHDSDGLSLLRGNGEWIWRPLVNPEQLRFNSYQDENPRGFGLLQRDRNFDHYQDDGVFYDRRPSVWVEPRAGWGRGAVQLVEIPTVDETFDNIVCFWNPEDRPQAGQEHLFAYRLHWGSRIPIVSPLASVVATRTGAGGVIGRKRSYYSRRFVVEFAGGDLKMLGKAVTLKPVISATRGRVELSSVRPLGNIAGYRVLFDLVPVDDSVAPIDLRVYLAVDSAPVSETWLYQWTPPLAAQRRF